MKRSISHIVMNMLIESGLTVVESRELVNKWGVPTLVVNVVSHPTAGNKLITELTYD